MTEKQYDDTNRGALFKNRKKVSDNHPDYTGSMNVGGIEYWLSSWIKKDRNDQVYMSLSVKAKTDKIETGPQRRAADLDDEIPF